MCTFHVCFLPDMATTLDPPFATQVSGWELLSPARAGGGRNR